MPIKREINRVFYALYRYDHSPPPYRACSPCILLRDPDDPQDMRKCKHKMNHRIMHPGHYGKTVIELKGVRDALYT